jgi:hypothetical protein
MSTPNRLIQKYFKEERLVSGIHAFLQLNLLACVLFALYQNQWLNAFAITGILLLTFIPLALKKRLSVALPSEFEFFITLFVYAALFLGEIHGYYTRYWWWDILLHLSSGLLLGIIGFLLVYLLNQEEQVHLNMNPAFVSLFACTFAVSIGVVWEIFEFAADSLLGLNMQKSGLRDTMWDLIVDAFGAACVAGIGYVYMRSGKQFRIESWIHRFILKNQKLFLRKNAA